jgi:hypothetical protein
LLVGAMWVSCKFESASSSSVGNKDRSHSDWPKKFPPNKLLFSTFRNVLNFIIRLCGPTVKVPIHSCVRCVFISLSFQLGRDTQIKNKKPFGRKNNISIPSSSSDSRSCPVVHSEDLKKVFFFLLFFSLKSKFVFLIYLYISIPPFAREKNVLWLLPSNGSSVVVWTESGPFFFFFFLQSTEIFCAGHLTVPNCDVLFKTFSCVRLFHQNYKTW